MIAEVIAANCAAEQQALEALEVYRVLAGEDGALHAGLDEAMSDDVEVEQPPALFPQRETASEEQSRLAQEREIEIMDILEQGDGDGIDYVRQRM